MNNASRLFMMAIATSAISFTASAAVVFQDDFESQALGNTLGPPPVGTWLDATTGKTPPFDQVAITASPGRGAKSLRLIRDGGVNQDLYGTSLPGAVVDGNIVEVKWSHNLECGHSLNFGMQVVIGAAGSNYSNDFAWVYDAPQPSGPDGLYHYVQGPGQYQTDLASAAIPTRNSPGNNEGKWDDFRAVFTFSQVNATTMGGTYSLYLSQNGGAEVTLANGVPIFQSSYNIADPTSMVMRINKGAWSGISYYDGISMNVIGTVPEPTALAGLAGVAVLGLRRRKS